MLNFLFYDNETGDNFFVQLEEDGTVEDAWEVAAKDFSPDYIEYIDCYTDEEAERMGYDTY